MDKKTLGPRFAVALHDKNGDICLPPVPVDALPPAYDRNGDPAIPLQDAAWVVRRRTKMPTGYILTIDGIEYHRGKLACPLKGFSRRDEVRLTDLRLVLSPRTDRVCPLGGKW